MNAIWQAFSLVFDPYVLMVIAGSAMFGLFVGAVPGLTATMAVALLVPITFFMEPVPAIAAIATAVTMAIFAGDVPGALLRIPGTPASAAYADEAFAMTRKGEAEKALGTSLVCACIGGLFGACVLTFAAPALAEVALKFSSFEFFWLACLGLSCAVFISRGSVVKSLVSLLLGLLIATVGVDIISGYPRFTFSSVELMGGVSFIPAMIGMFAIPEIIRFATERRQVLPQHKAAIGKLFHGIGATLRRYKLNVLRSSVLGTAIGVLPGAGADIAAWVAYATSKKMSKEPEKFGQGHVEGLVDAGSANNAALGGAWVPAMVFGIPGDSVTAIVIGVLYMKGMNPGPTVFLNRPDLVYSVFIVFILANLILLPFGYLLIRLARHILQVPRRALMPIILLFCIVGSFAINNTAFGVSVMLVLGLLAFIMEENDIPVAPAILGIVLGPLLEGNFITSMIKADGSYLAFFERPIAAVLGVITLAIWLLPPVLKWLLSRTRATAGQVDTDKANG